MKLCRYGKAGYEKPGMIDGEGRLRDLSKVIDNIGPNELSPRGLKMLTKLKPESLPPVNGNPRLGVPYVGIGKFVAIGLNYSDHAKEAGLPIPAEPIVFMKATTCISGPNDDVIQPKGSTKLDWEVELGIVIGTQAKYVSEAEALGHHAVGQGQGLRYRRPDRSLARHHRRDPRPADARHVARRERQAHAKRQHAHHDLRLREDHLARQPLHDPAARRHHLHRHAAGGRPRHQAEPGVPQAGRRHDPRHPGFGRTTPESRGFFRIGFLHCGMRAGVSWPHEQAR
jgi:hypothetical protein